MINRLSKLIIAMLFFMGNKIYRIICRLCGKYIPPTLVILTYHSIKASSLVRFKNQMDILLNTGVPIPLDMDMSMLPGKYYIAVTFDDAYQSVLKNALPILIDKKIQATIFVPTGCLGSKPIWIKNPSHICAREIVITETQLKTLPSHIITIGSHTVSHINITKVDENIARSEIFKSKETLERILNKKVTLFAAPYAMVNENYVDLFKKAGYQRIFLNIPTYPATKTDSYILGRTSVEPTDWQLEFRLKLVGAYQWLPLAINVKRKFT